MEIEQFLSHDIQEYLDIALDRQQSNRTGEHPDVTPSIFLNHDYEKEFSAAIAKEDYVQAKKVMESLKQEFDNCAPNTPDKEQLKSLLLALYERFKTEVEAHHAYTNVNQGLQGNSGTSVHSLGIPSHSVNTPQVQVNVITSPTSIPGNFHSTYGTSSYSSESIDEPKPPMLNAVPTSSKTTSVAPERPQPPTQTHESKSSNVTVRVQHNQEKKDDPVVIVIENPHFEVSHAEAFEHPTVVPSSSPAPEHHENPIDPRSFKILLDDAETALRKNDLKTAIYRYREAKDLATRSDELPAEIIDHFRAAYSSIRAAMTDRETTVQDWTAAPEDMDRQLLLQIEREKRLLDQFLHKNDFNGSMQQYQKMQQLASQLHDQKKQQATQEKLRRIQTIITEIRQHGSNDEHGLTAVP